MCGILAVSSPIGRKFPIQNILDKIKHRGPDDSGVFISDSEDCYLGHTRLSILDLSQSGHQPMKDATGRFVISYNGEIYNYNELKIELESRYGRINWVSKTDTEVIIEGFSREGVNFLDKLNGIFSLVIYDSHEKLLYVLRDPLGIKPVFFVEYLGSVIFCSELQGLSATNEIKLTLRLDSLAAQLAFMYVPEPYTLYNEIKKLKPGTCFVYKKGVLVSSKPLFSHLHSRLTFSNEDEIVSELKHLFSKAVDRQLMADVPVSLFLSGGLDSSAVSLEAVKKGANIRDAYTIAFSKEDQRLDAQSDDLHYARLMAEHLNLKLEVIMADNNMLSLLPEIIQYMEDGFTDPAAINTYLMCAEARKNGVKVILSGQGADEYLGGYRRYLAEKLLAKIPSPLKSTISLFADILPNQIPGRMNAINRRIKRFGKLSGKSSRDRIFGMYSWANYNEISNLFLQEVDFGYKDDFFELYELKSSNTIIDTMMNIDHHYDLMSLNLCYTDRMSMANGVEVRVPFLDFDLVRLMNSIPSDYKVRHMQGKYILKKAMESKLPHEVIYRDKAGFGMPIRSWMQNSKEMLHHYLDSNRIKKQGIFNANSIDRLLVEEFRGEKDNAHLLLTLLIQQIWFDKSGAL